MTVCIAALYGNGAGVVLASDQMVTAQIPPIAYEFEHQENAKIVPIDGDGDSASTYALSAGDVLLGTQILSAAKEQLRGQQSPVSASEVAQLVRTTYQQVRLGLIVQRELEPRGLNLETYYNGQQTLMPQIVQAIDIALSQGDIGVEFIIAGRTECRYTIHTITSPGVQSEHTPIGYCAIGSGAPHAMYSLIGASYKSSLDRESVRVIVEKAKEQSEVAPGVGKKTQVLVSPRGDDK